MRRFSRGCTRHLVRRAYTKKSNVSNDAIMNVLADTQHDIHAWGERNRVIFDVSKEHKAVIHPQLGEGDDFKLLGCIIDNSISMKNQIESTLKKCRPRIMAMTRTRMQYNVESMIDQYKSQIWDFLEFANGSVCHAIQSELDRFASMQRGFLHAIHLDAKTAFLEYNFAPPSTRRDIGMLG